MDVPGKSLTWAGERANFGHWKISNKPGLPERTFDTGKMPCFCQVAADPRVNGQP